MTNPELGGVDDYQGAATTPGSTGVDVATLYGVDAATAALQVQTGQRGESAGYGFNARAADSDSPNKDTDPGAKTPLTQNILSILQSLNSMNPKNRKVLQEVLRKAGYLNENYLATGNVDKDFVSGFVEMLSEYARSNEIPETIGPDGRVHSEGLAQSISWMSYLNNKARETEEATKELEKEKNPPKVELVNYNMVAPAYKESFRAAVGRDPSDVEINAFVDAYNAKARENPLTKKVEMVDGVEVTSYEGGVSEDFMSDQIEENADYANYQAVSTYFPAMERILGGGPDLNLIQGI